MIIVYLLLILSFTLCVAWSVLFVKYLMLKRQIKKDAYVMFNNPNPSELDYVGYTMGKYMLAYHTFPWNKRRIERYNKRNEFLRSISVERTERFLSIENKLFLTGYAAALSCVVAFMLYKIIRFNSR